MIDINNYLDFLENDNEESKNNAQYQKNLFLQYASINDEFVDKRKALLLKYNKGKATLEGKNGVRRQLGAFDLEYFGRAYLPHFFVRKSPEFHHELDLIWLNGITKGTEIFSRPNEVNKLPGCKRGIAAPRGHAKSTTFTFKGGLHAALYMYKHYILILSDSSEQSEGFLADIRTELEENNIIKADFGELEGKVWTTKTILTKTGIKIEAIGSGKKVRGRRHRNWRPDLIILDDVENDENVNTPEQRRKLESWFYKAVSKAGDTYTDIVYIGTILHYDGLLAHVLNNPSYQSIKYRGVISEAVNTSLWDMWESIYTDLSNDNRQDAALKFYEENKADMLEGTKVLWEDKLSYYDLMCIKVSEGTAAFNSEIQNEPIDPENCVFNEEWFDYYDEGTVDFTKPNFVAIGANDPSLGKNKRADTSAIINIMKDVKTGYLYVETASIERRSPDVIIEDAIEISRRLKRDYSKGFRLFGVETIQFQYFFKDIMRERSREADEHLPIEEIHSSQSKDLRIRSLQPFVKNGYIKFNKKHKTLLKQMLEYPMGRNDDGPDALEMAVRLAMKTGSAKIGDYMTAVSRRIKFNKGAY